MFLQVTNLKLKSYNQFRTTKNNLFKDTKERGWDLKECKVSELKNELVKNVYKSADGKNTLPSK